MAPPLPAASSDTRGPRPSLPPPAPLTVRIVASSSTVTFRKAAASDAATGKVNLATSSSNVVYNVADGQTIHIVLAGSGCRVVFPAGLNVTGSIISAGSGARIVMPQALQNRFKITLTGSGGSVTSE